MKCRVCSGDVRTREGVCFDCMSMESLIDEGLDAWDKPVGKHIEGSKALNILYTILRTYKVNNENRD